jgi:pimeloyl-ACP methyl ester carboxylesterase
MHLMRTRFKENIVSEFFPAYFGNKKKVSNKVIIFCDGMPGVPSKKSLMEFWSKKGYWTFHPRYRGTWESGGGFLTHSPDEDIVEIIDELFRKKSVVNYWNNTCHDLETKEVYVVGSSFGGAAALLLSRDKRVKKVVCVSPVVDWTDPSEEEPIDFFGEVIKNAFGEGYRFAPENWDRLKTGEFYNPVKHKDEIDGKKVMIIHAQDDKIVMPKAVEQFAKDIKCNFIYLDSGGHLSSRMLTKYFMYLKVKKFFGK